MAEKKSIKQSKAPFTEKDKGTGQNIEMKKIQLIRLDQLLIQLGYAQSRERAKALIKAGYVLVDGSPVIKVAKRCASDARIEVMVGDISWVS